MTKRNRKHNKNPDEAFTSESKMKQNEKRDEAKQRAT